MGLVITSSIAKVVQHRSLCEGRVHPVSAQIVLTNKCNLRCSFCTNKHGDRKKSMTTSHVRDILDFLHSAGCKGVEFTGGGEPTVYEGFASLVSYAISLGMDVGLITNGTRLGTGIYSDILPELDWVRVSLNSSRENYKGVHGVGLYDRVLKGLGYLDKSGVFYGISYIYSDQGKEDLLSLSKDLGNQGLKNLAYMRIAADVLKQPYDKDFMQDLKESAFSVLSSFTKVDYQAERDLSIPKECIMHKLKPCFDADGKVYPCCIAQYGKFNCVGALSDYTDIVQGKKEYAPNVNLCPYCIYKEVNDFVIVLKESDVKNPNFI